MPETFDYSNSSTEPSKDQPADFASKLLEFTEIVVTAILITVMIFVFVFRTVGVRGESMINTLQNDDRLIVTHLFYTPKQGDIVVLELPELFDTPIIKRVIATGGQTVNILDDGTVEVDGQVLQEDYIHDLTSPKNGEFPLEVPEGYVFVMGDNRVDSRDSRDFGCVDEHHILGKAVLRIYPASSFGLIE